MPEKNIELARKVREWTRAHPDLLDMDTWIDTSGTFDELLITTVENAETCGTTACFAGWTAILSGDRVGAGGMIFDAEGNPVMFEMHDGYTYPLGVEQRAMDLLGLEKWEANRLFMCDEDDLDDVLFEIFGQEI